MDMVNGGGLHVNGGTEPEDPDYHLLPKGVYATEVAPYSIDITQSVLSRFVSNYERAPPDMPMATELGQDVSYFLMFAPSVKWSSFGYIQYCRPPAAFTKLRLWVMKSDMAPGSIVSYDIIAYGMSHIPMNVEEMDTVYVPSGDCMPIIRVGLIQRKSLKSLLPPTHTALDLAWVFHCASLHLSAICITPATQSNGPFHTEYLDAVFNTVPKKLNLIYSCTMVLPEYTSSQII